MRSFRDNSFTFEATNCKFCDPETFEEVFGVDKAQITVYNKRTVFQKLKEKIKWNNFCQNIKKWQK